MAWIDAAFSLPTVEEILDRLAGEEGVAARSLSALQRASPSSLKVALRQIRTGATLTSLADCLQMEFRQEHPSLSLSYNCCPLFIYTYL
jgi:enoyl-CoA hydratase